MTGVVPIKRLNAGDGLRIAEDRFLVDVTATPWTKDGWGELVSVADSTWLSPERARRALEAAPADYQVKGYIAALEATLTAPDPRSTVVMIGMLVDAFPNSKASGAYIDAATHDVVSSGFSPFELATACRDIRRSCKFLPSIAELLDACAKVRKSNQSGLYLAQRLERALDRLRIAAEEPQP